MSEFDKIRWRSRRGLLELDIILERFLVNEWDGLTQEQRDIYVEILEELDNDLLDLINDRKENTNPRWDEMMAMLKAA